MTQLMPSFLAIGIGGGLTIPMTATVLSVMPQEQAGVASGVFNTLRELAGLLGITVIGVILTSRQSAEHQGRAHPGRTRSSADTSWGLVIAGALVVAGAVAAWAALRQAEAEPIQNADVVLAA